MFIQITKQEFSKEILKKVWHQTNLIVFAAALIYPLFSIVDYLYAPAIWLQFFIARIIISVALYGLHRLFHNKQYDSRLLLHISFLLLSITSALSCSLVSTDHLTVYFLLYAAVILFFNHQAIWKPINSVIQTLLAFLFVLVFFKLFSTYNLALFTNNGVQLFIITAVVSCLIPNLRYQALARDVRSQILIERSNEQLKDQNHDINEKNKIIAMQYEQLLKLDEHKSKFINIVGHDLKNLVGSVIMSNVLIQEENYRLSADQKEYSRFIAESADKMQYLLKKLVDMREIESPETKFNMEVFDINAEVTHVVKRLNETAQMKNIHLVDNILKLPLHVKLDRVFVGQVFQNLLANSIKFSQINNNIVVTTSLHQHKFIFEIIDEGIAIGQEELDTMFNKLKILNGSAKLNENKLGLGLSIAKTMTKEMGGELTYRSDDNGNYISVEFGVVN
jgi:signal transduction histidine kinase